MVDNTKYTFEEILDIVKNSKFLTNTQKVMVNLYFDAAAQAVYNAATNQHGGLKCNSFEELDMWEIYYNNMIQTLHLAKNMKDFADLN